MEILPRKREQPARWGRRAPWCICATRARSARYTSGRGVRVARMDATHHAPSTADVTAYLLTLHERAHELGYREFQRFALERLARVVAFDAGLVGVGTLQHGVPHAHD